jgi:PAS domain S-box-containing protein
MTANNQTGKGSRKQPARPGRGSRSRGQTSPAGAAGITREDVTRLEHELEVHQVELEAQNEEMKRTREELATARDRYAELYDFAPVGYLTLDRQGAVKEANITVCQMLGVKRAELLKKKFVQLIAPEYRDTFYLHCRQTARTDRKQTAELVFLRTDGSTFPGEMTSTNDWNGIRSSVSDISHRKTAEKERAKAEEMFRLSVENMPGCLGVYSAVRGPDGRIVDFRFEYVNQAACLNNRMTREEQVGRNLLEILPAHRSSGLFDEYVKVVETGIPLEKVSFVYVDNFAGEVLDRAFDIRAARLGDGFVASWYDVTERKKMENDLCVKDYAISSSVAGIGITDLNGNLTFVNPALADMGGYREDEVLGKRVHLFFEDENQVAAVFKGVIETGFWQGELEARRKDGSTFWVQTWANRVNDSEGRPICLMASVVDISRRRHMEEQLVRQASILETVMANTDAKLVYLDRDFNFVMANKAYLEACGHSWEELEGKNHFSFFPNAENEAIFRMVRDTREAISFTDKPFEYADQPWRGVTYWDWTLVPIGDGHGDVTGLVFSLVDTTERKKTTQLKDEFIGMVSHELKTPLTVIMGALRVATSPGVSREELQVLLRDAISSTENMAGIVENLLELSRFQADRLELHPRLADLGSIARDVTRKLGGKSTKHRLVIELPDISPDIQVDPVRVERILFNLVENAIKYSPEGGEVKISAQRVDSDLVVSVSDQGPGISVRDQKKLFRSFEQLEIENRRAMQGVGLGLKVCRTLVEAHGGRIWVDSRRGHGATFHFTLPAVNGTAAE